MVPSSQESPATQEVEAAIARVLAAEHEARAAVAACEREAEAIRAAARSRAKRTAERAANRIAAIRAGLADKLSGRLAAIDAEFVAPDPQAAQDAAAHARLDAAVGRLADELIGARP